MRAILASGLIASLLGTCAAPAFALPVSQPPQVGNQDVVRVQAEFHRQFRGGAYRGGVYRGGHYYRRGGYGGAAIGAGVAGLAAGALIGGALAGSAGADYDYGAPGYEDAAPVYAGEADTGSSEYCVNRFQSYDPASGTYLGYDGLRHPCP